MINAKFISQRTFRCRRIQDLVGRYVRYQDAAIFKTVRITKYTIQEMQPQHHQQMQLLALLYQPHQIPLFISNKINSMNNYFITINSYCRCEYPMVHHNKPEIQFHSPTINLCRWKIVCRKFKTTFESQHRSSTRSTSKRYETIEIFSRYF